MHLMVRDWLRRAQNRLRKKDDKQKRKQDNWPKWQYTLDKDGKRVYTLKKVLNGEVTKSAHPARFSPDDKYSRYVLNLRCGLWER